MQSKAAISGVHEKRNCDTGVRASTDFMGMLSVAE